MGLFNKLFKSEKRSFDYIVFDLETSGVNINKCEILEIGAIGIIDNEIVETFSSLCRPTRPVDKRALEINNLDINLLKKAPPITTVLPRFLKFVAGNKVVGYNINRFDLPIIFRYIEELNLYKNFYDGDDVYELVKNKLPNLPNKRLTTVAEHLQVPFKTAHRAVDDSIITFQCYEKLKKMPDVYIKTRSEYGSKLTAETISLRELDLILKNILSDGVIEDEEIQLLNCWLEKNNSLSGSYPYDIIWKTIEELSNQKCDITKLEIICDKILSGDLCDRVNQMISIEGKGCVITGDFEYGNREDIEEIITKCGGIIKSGVSSKVTFVIVGKLGSPAWSAGNYGNKIKRAKELQLKGQNLLIISEDDFISACSEKK